MNAQIGKKENKFCLHNLLNTNDNYQTDFSLDSMPKH